MKKWKVILGLLLACAAFSQAGEIKYNSVPGGITYQGRLERDNAPITGVVHIYFRLYNGLTGGILRWDSGEITTTATGGIFSASFTPPLSVLGNGEQLYLEVQIEGEVLSPREAINSVMYSLISKKLEDGANVAISTLTAGYTVLLATQPYANVGIGENNPNMKLVVGGSIRVLSGGQLCFDDSGCTNNVGSGSAGSLTNLTDANINADSDANATGAVVFNTAGSEKIRMLNNGNLGIGTASPAEKLYVVGNSSVTGNMYMGSAGVFNNGMFPGANSEKIYVGSPDNVISFYSNGGERMRIDANNYIGIGNSAPTQPLEVTGKALASSGFAGAQVGVGAYWGSYSNELRSADAANLVVQYSNPMNVGIGMLNPTEKLDVNGSIRAEKGIISSTAAFADDVTILGNLNVNGYNKVVNLSTTNVYGTFTVFGTLNLGNGGSLVSLGSTQTFSGENTFLGQTVISSQTVVNTRMGVGMIDFDFPGARYLQVGDSNVSFSNQDALLYLVGGSLASAKVDFYRGGSEVGRIETIGSGSLSFDVGGQKAVMDSSNVKVYNSNFIVSPSGSDVTPSIYVDKTNYNVGIGTTSATYRLNIDGTLKLVGAGSAIMFNDGTVLTSSGSSTAQGISNAGDAVIWADSDADGVGKVILKAGGGSNTGLAVNSNGQVGIGIVDPYYKLDVNGDINTHGSLRTGGLERIDNAGNVGSGGLNATWDGATINVSRGGTGRQTFTSGGVIYGNDTNGLNITPAMGAGGLVIGGPAGTLSTGTITSANTNRVTVTNGNGTISLSGPQDINTTSSPQFAGLTVTGPATVTGSFNSAGLTASSGTFTAFGATQYSVQTTSGILVSAGNIQTPAFKMTTSPGFNYFLVSDAAGNGTWKSISGIGDKWGGQVVNKDTTLTGDGVSALGINLANPNTWTAAQTFSGGVTCTDCITLGGETSGDYVGSVTGSNGVAVTGSGGENSMPNVSLTGQALALHNLATNGIIARTVAGAVSARTITAGSTKVSITNGDGVSGNPIVDVTEANLNLANMGGTLDAANGGTGISGAGGTSNRVLVTTNGTSWTTAQIGSTLTSGASSSFDVVVTTTPPQQCKSIVFTNGLITSIGTNHDCTN